MPSQTKYKRKSLELYGWDNSWDITDKQQVLKFITEARISSERVFSYIFKDLYEQFNLIESIKTFNKFPQKLYHFLHNDLELNLGLCKVCGKRCSFKNLFSGYKKYCSPTCLMHDPEMLDRIKLTNLRIYGCESSLQNKEVRQKIENTNWRRYGAKYACQTEETKEKTKQTFLKKYGTISYSQTQEYKKHMLSYDIYPSQREEVKKARAKTCYDKYNAICFLLSKEYFDSIHGKKLEKLSKLEIGFENYLKNYKINYYIQYRSNLYPYRCDFYLPDSDLYVELNGTWTHGKAPHNKYSEKDFYILKEWEEKAKTSDYYVKAIKTWTKLDLEKILYAEEHNLNFLVLYYTSPKECFDNLVYNLSKTDLTKLDNETFEYYFPKDSIKRDILDKLETLQ